MLEHGYTVSPVNPRYDSILGQKCYKSLRDIPTKVDIVDCFRKTEDIMPIAEDAIAIGAKVLWQQLGVKNTEAAKKAEAAGLEAGMGCSGQNGPGGALSRPDRWGRVTQNNSREAPARSRVLKEI